MERTRKIIKWMIWFSLFYYFYYPFDYSPLHTLLWFYLYYKFNKPQRAIKLQGEAI